jgi:hypothetical protein
MTREQGTGKRFWATLLLVTYVGFFPFTYLFKAYSLSIAYSDQSNPVNPQILDILILTIASL